MADPIASLDHLNRNSEARWTRCWPNKGSQAEFICEVRVGVLKFTLKSSSVMRGNRLGLNASIDRAINRRVGGVPDRDR